MKTEAIEVKAHSKTESQRVPSVAWSFIWYALAGLAVIFSLYLFMSAEGEGVTRQHAVALFVGLWAPMFAILGLRFEVMELRNDVSRMVGRKR